MHARLWQAPQSWLAGLALPMPSLASATILYLHPTLLFQSWASSSDALQCGPAAHTLLCQSWCCPAPAQHVLLNPSLQLAQLVNPELAHGALPVASLQHNSLFQSQGLLHGGLKLAPPGSQTWASRHPALQAMACIPVVKEGRL